jgi:hypothetical protein
MKLERLALAMMTYEGWTPAGPEPGKNGSRSYRNHNPGNLRSSPFQKTSKEGFAVFETDFEGWFALIWDLRQKCTGNTKTGLNGESTIADLIKVWAPENDGNIPEQYVKAIHTFSGFPPSTKLKELV